ncbi:RNA polymerase sigma factor [Pseudomarimonas arenosa]|uniref:RNA polymerase sigma factor n=1 Tax=Pseudomarimonas arenosa TaxID=2774145 RepID=A0AAW3ZLT1_9GAMM|nr:RNA polymerase sigma factor [Pseudomarimonas arenosa]MBD8526137.1 RNA polymerase sigma factor [Pseudomarimonas arenosa]
MNPQSPFAIEIPALLLASAKRGDERALEAIYRQFQGPAYQLAWRLCGDRELARDMVQESMFKAFRQLHQFRADAPFWAWLRQVLVNECLMHLRRQQRIEQQQQEPDLQAEETNLSLPPEVAECGLLQSALERLPTSTRAVLWLYHVEGYTHEEIASLMQRTISFSKSQLSRGTQRLREMLCLKEELSHV